MRQLVTDIAIDSTGLKIYGEGEWKTRVHGKGKRRTWRKLHIAIDLKSGQIMRMELTKASVGDDPMLPPLFRGVKGNRWSVCGWGLYFKSEFQCDSEGRREGKDTIEVRDINKSTERRQRDSREESVGDGR